MFHDISIILHLPNYDEMSGRYQNHSGHSKLDGYLVRGRTDDRLVLVRKRHEENPYLLEKVGPDSLPSLTQ